MNLPFLKQKRMVGTIISHRKPDGDAPKPLDESEESGNSAMEACAEDIMRAISSKDSKHLALALQAAFDCMEAAPHDENDNSYDAQNAKAAQEAKE